MGYYLDERLVLILIESSRTRQHRGIEWPFQIWNGCLFPIERIKQNKVFSNFPFLENHPVSDQWLYLPQETEEFEDRVKILIRELKKRNPLFGTVPTIKSAIRKTNQDLKIESLQNGLGKPQLFSDAPLAKLVKKKVIRSKKVKANKKPGNQLLIAVLKGRKSGQ